MLFYSQAVADNGLKVRDFLEWDRDSQNTFFRVSILTASVIATQIRSDFAGCISDWYGDNGVGDNPRHDFILGLMRDYPEHLPSGIVVAVLQKECGEFGDL